MSEAVAETNVPTDESDISVTVDDRPDYSKAESLQVGIALLQGIVETVKERGVCQADVAAAQSVVADIAEKLPDIDTSTGLENYRGLFTAERSMINQQVSVESFLEDIVRFIKKLIEEAKTLATSMYRWVKALIKDLQGVEGKCDELQGKILEIRKLYQFLLPGFQWQNMPNADAIAKDILMDPKLERSLMQRIAFGHKDDLAEYTRTVTSTKMTVDTLEIRMAQAVKLAKTNVVDSSVFDSVIQTLSFTDDAVTAMQSISPEPKYHVLSSPDFYKSAPNFTSTVNLDLEHVCEVYKKCDDHLGQLKRIAIDAESNADAMQDLVVSLIKAMNILDRIIAGLSTLPKCRMKYLVCQYNFFAKMLNATKSAIIESSMPSAARTEQLAFLDAIVKAAK